MNLIIFLGSPNDLLGLLENEKDAEGNLVLEMLYEKYNLTKTEGHVVHVHGVHVAGGHRS